MVGTKFCQIGDPKRLEARLVIDQGDVELVAKGQKVKVMLEQSADFVYVSHVEDVSAEDLKTSPVHLSSLHGGALPTKMDDSGTPRPLGLVFEAVVPLPEDKHDVLRIGLVGEAKITTAPGRCSAVCTATRRGRLTSSCRNTAICGYWCAGGMRICGGSLHCQHAARSRPVCGIGLESAA